MPPPSFHVYAGKLLVCLVAVGGLALAGTALVRTNNVYALSIAGAGLMGLTLVAIVWALPARRAPAALLVPLGATAAAARDAPRQEAA